MVTEFDQVALTVDLPEHGLQAGDVGTAVDITPNGREYALEFFNSAGDTVAVVPVAASQVRPLGPREITHTRTLDPVL